MITAQKDSSLRMPNPTLNRQIWKNKYQMPYIPELIDSAAQIITRDVSCSVWLTSLDLKYAFSQIKISKATSSHCNFNIICGKSTGTYQFNSGFYGLTDLPSEFQKAMDCTLQRIPEAICYSADILVVSNRTLSKNN